MFARVVSLEWKAYKLDEAIKIYKESGIPAMKPQKGFISLSLLIDRNTGKGKSVAIWATEEDMLATMESGLYKEQIEKFKDYYIGTPTVDMYEVVAQS